MELKASDDGFKVVTLIRHIMESQHLHPTATGEFSGLLTGIASSAKIISREVNKAGLSDILGMTGRKNVQGEDVQKLDELSNEIIMRHMDHLGHICIMASEEISDPIFVPKQYKKGKYVLSFDPLDGSSNIDVNVSVGTIFSVYRRITEDGDGTMDDLLQQGINQVAAGYVIYGSSTMFVYTTGAGVHGFTLDPSIGEFLLSHPDIRIPERGKIYSINEAYEKYWHERTKRYISYLKQKESPYTARYIGTLVSDFHRNLLRGGIFLYPQDSKTPNGKLRLVYEANPMAFIAEQAGGNATNGDERILELKPKELHQRVPLIIGSKQDVKEYKEYWQGKR
ncbi:MAG: class 1 fructose-bisphosphatase [Nitrospirota bacterium]